MGPCVVEGCKSRSDRKSNLRYFQIPEVQQSRCKVTEERSTRRRALWLARLNKPYLREEDIKDHVKICSRHFLKGAPAGFPCEDDPDWAPSLFMGGHENISNHQEEYVAVKQPRADNTTTETANHSDLIIDNRNTFGSVDSSMAFEDTSADVGKLSASRSKLENLDNMGGAESEGYVDEHGDSTELQQKVEELERRLKSVQRENDSLREQLSLTQAKLLAAETKIYGTQLDRDVAVGKVGNPSGPAARRNPLRGQLRQEPSSRYHSH